MIDNKALSPEAWFHTKRALACVEALNKVGFTAVYAATREEAVKTVLDAVSEGSTVGIGGSVTVRELGLPEALKRKGCKVFDHWDQSLSPEERGRTRYSQIVADVFLSSTNAVTMKGTLINIDGFG
ncbi:MAG: lactate utilization protein, partial [Bacillota bacterium]